MKFMSPVDKKVLGALLISADENMKVKRITQKQISNIIGYKASGGIITYSLRILEMNNYITKIEDKAYLVHI